MTESLVTQRAGALPEAMKTSTYVDEGFIRQALVYSLIFAVLGAAIGYLYGGPRWGAGVLVGGLWSAANFKALEQLIRLALRPTGRSPMAIAIAMLIKAPLLYGIGALIVLKGGFPAESLIVGFSFPLIVVVLKAGGKVLAPRMMLPDRGETSDNGNRSSHDNGN